MFYQEKRFKNNLSQVNIKLKLDQGQVHLSCHIPQHPDTGGADYEHLLQCKPVPVNMR